MKNSILILIGVALLSTGASAQENPFQHSVAIAARGGVQGGGGDVQTEARIKDIRDDLLSWIKRGGAEALDLPRGLTYEQYLNGDPTRALYGMLDVLAPDAVVVNAIRASEQNLEDEELNTRVDGKPKTCKGLISARDERPHLICEVERFAMLSESEQYQLIHHEYASLGLLERNVGSDSDYSISRQLSAYLLPTTVLRLAVLPKTPAPAPFSTDCRVHIRDYPYIAAGVQYRYETGSRFHYIRPGRFGIRRDVPADLIERLTQLGYQVVTKRDEANLAVSGTYETEPTSHYYPDSGSIATVELWHMATGYHVGDVGYGKKMMEDPRKLALLAKREQAKSLTEYAAIDAELKAGGFTPIPEKSGFMSLELPTCAEFYGKIR